MSHVKTSYTFDAPTEFINFTSLDDEEDSENVDLWFGKCHFLRPLLGLVTRFVLGSLRYRRNCKKIAEIEIPF